jgi:hypothetical protein
MSQPPVHSLRTRLWDILGEGKGTLGRMYKTLLVTFIIVSMALLPLEFIAALAEYHDTLLVIEIITTIAFTLDYMLHIYAAPKRIKYIFSFYGVIDLLSILPFFLGFLGTQYVRIFRITRLVRLARIGEIKGASVEDNTRLSSRLHLHEHETIDYVVTMHPIYLILGCFLPAISSSIAIGILLFFENNPIVIALSGCLFLFALMFAWKTWLDYRYDVIYVTSHRLIWQNQYLLGRSINQVNYHSITNVKPYFGSFLGYVLRYGSIKIETNAAETGHTELHMVREHEKAAYLIMQRTFQTNHAAKPAAATPPPVPQP